MNNFYKLVQEYEDLVKRVARRTGVIVEPTRYSFFLEMIERRLNKGLPVEESDLFTLANNINKVNLCEE